MAGPAEQMLAKKMATRRPKVQLADQLPKAPPPTPLTPSAGGGAGRLRMAGTTNPGYS